MNLSSEGFSIREAWQFAKIIPPVRLSFSNTPVYRVRSKKLLEPAMATDWSMTHSPRPRYLLIHLLASLLSPATFSVLKVKPVDRFIPARNAEMMTASKA